MAMLVRASKEISSGWSGIRDGSVGEGTIGSGQAVAAEVGGASTSTGTTVSVIPVIATLGGAQTVSRIDITIRICNYFKVSCYPAQQLSLATSLSKANVANLMPSILVK